MSKQTAGTPLGRDPQFQGELSGPAINLTGQTILGLPATADHTAEMVDGQVTCSLDGTDLVFHVKTGGQVHTHTIARDV